MLCEFALARGAEPDKIVQPYEFAEISAPVNDHRNSNRTVDPISRCGRIGDMNVQICSWPSFTSRSRKCPEALAGKSSVLGSLVAYFEC